MNARDSRRGARRVLASRAGGSRAVMVDRQARRTRRRAAPPHERCQRLPARRSQHSDPRLLAARARSFGAAAAGGSRRVRPSSAMGDPRPQDLGLRRRAARPSVGLSSPWMSGRSAAARDGRSTHHPSQAPLTLPATDSPARAPQPCRPAATAPARSWAGGATGQTAVAVSSTLTLPPFAFARGRPAQMPPREATERSRTRADPPEE